MSAELAVVGAAMLNPSVLGRYAVDDGLRPEHFADQGLAEMWKVMLGLQANGRPVDEVTVGAALAHDALRSQLHEAIARTPVVGNVSEYARMVLADHRWRARRHAAASMTAAADARDDTAFDQAHARLSAVLADRDRRRHFTASDAAARFHSQLANGDSLRLPFHIPRLNDYSRGGVRMGRIMVLAGPTSHGKSIVCDQILERFASVAGPVRVYLTEMDSDERMERVCARHTDVPLETIQDAAAGRHRLTEREATAVDRALAKNVIETVDAEGWSIRDIVLHARQKPCQVLAIDTVNRLRFDRSRNRAQEMSDAAEELDRHVKATGTHGILVAHVNRERARQDGRWPIPSLADLKDCAALGEIADYVLMVWRSQDRDSLDPQDEGVLRLAKCRGGRLGGVKVIFQGAHQRFLPAEDRDAPQTYGEFSGQVAA